MAPKIDMTKVNHLIETVMKRPTKQKVGILVAINVVIFALVGYLLTYPRYAEMDRLDTEIEKLEKELVNSREIASNKAKYQKEKEDLENRLNIALKQLPNEKEIPDLVDNIAEASKQSKLKLLTFKPDKEVPKGFYAEMPFTMEVSGGFENIYDFSLKIADLPRIVNISRLKIDNKPSVGAERPLKINFIATTFKFIPKGAEDVNAPKKAGGAKKDD